MQETLYELLVNFKLLIYPLFLYIIPTYIEPPPDVLQVFSVFPPLITILPLYHTCLQP